MRTSRPALTWAVLAHLVFVGPLLGTAQQADILLLDGEEYPLLTNPLTVFLRDHPEKRPRSDIISTGLWRGYAATWEVKNDRFLLSKVEVLKAKEGAEHLETELHDVTATVFPGQREVLAEWYTGHLVVPTGDLVNYVHMGYASTYRKYLILRVEDGRVTGQWNVGKSRFRRFRQAQLEMFKKTDEYRTALTELTEEDRSEEDLDLFLSQVLSEQYMSMIFPGVEP